MKHDFFLYGVVVVITLHFYFNDFKEVLFILHLQCIICYIFPIYQMFFKSLSKNEKESLLCFKEIYLLGRGKTFNNNGELMIRSKLRNGMKMISTNFSSQLTEDLVDCVLNCLNNEAICCTVGDVSCSRKILFNNLLSYFILCQYPSFQ